eukprot:g6481.t1
MTTTTGLNGLNGCVVCNMFGQIQLGAPMKCGKHPDWYCPTLGEDRGLKVLNTLVNKKVPFIPASGRKVLWYTCGPTVYDSCHMGHARAYLTFDILRRIMEDYFNYEVIYHVNITDIDDKIIMRARQNKLIDDLVSGLPKEANVAFESVCKTVDEALIAAEAKIKVKMEKLNQPLPAEANSRDVEERETKLKETQLKMNQLQSVRDKVQTVISRGADGKGGEVKVLKELALEAGKAGLQGSAGMDAATLYSELSNLITHLKTTLEDSNATFDKNAVTSQVAALFSCRDKLSALQKATAEGAVAGLIAAARTQIGALLDQQKGDTITEHSIFDAHARKYELEYLQDMERLGVREPDVLTRVTEYVPEIVAFVEAVVKKGLAYESNGSVYLDIQAFEEQGHSYRKLKPFAGTTSAEDMAESEGALQGNPTEKKHPNDFVLWKKSKRGEPEWPSPWGHGRPGWHIECSVIASDILGQNMDIHAGGVDLKFPHHDNELAQSEARFGTRQWVNYFFHAGHLHIKGLKMSKSLKNFVTIRQALKVHSPRQLRLMFLLQPWDKPMNFSDQTVGDAVSKERTLKAFFGKVKEIARREWLKTEIGWRNREEDRALYMDFQKCQSKVHDALCDNFDTPSVILAIIDHVNKVNKYLQSFGDKPAVYLLKKIAMYFTKILRILGVVEGADMIGFPAGGKSGGAQDREAVIAPVLDSFVDFRDTVRSAARKKLDHSEFLNVCDSVRDDVMPNLGVRIEDRLDGSGSAWKLDDPEELKREVAEKRRRDMERAAAKKANQISKLQKSIDKWTAAAVPATEYFMKGANSGKYKAYDDEGVPTTLADGTVLSKGQVKKCGKELKRHLKNQMALKKLSDASTGGDMSAYIESLRKQLKELSL